MNDFLEAFNKKQKGTGEVIRPFIGCPTLLSLAERQELIYRFQFLEETIEALSLHYRLTPSLTRDWLEQEGISRQALETEEDLLDFENHVNKLYKSLQVRLLGLAALNTAKSWQALATSEEDLLASLNNATRALRTQEFPEPKTITSLASAHAKLVARHEMIQTAMENAGDVIEVLKEQLGWELEVTHVDFKAKDKTREDEDDEDDEDLDA